ncbi:ANTAR domain-containing protein [Amycolatopsis magusensis]|uniref:ANTAR domain-containing protein n=1 Tax=Amycolatopsis magusensis TaxID=882444 RepID=A0ABS4Q1N8_9PSEU|nr:GAF and ANTAR domain-containing protein [Amycolatopsis magusensis]MBP2185594.1 hypothetical protein [Amycolatopsis magusensis]
MSPSDEDWLRDRDRFAAGGEPVRDDGARPGPLARQFATLTYSLLDATTAGQVFQQITETALRVVSGADLVSITLRAPDGSFHTPTMTDRVAAELDRLQYEFCEGPCVAAADPAGPTAATSADLAVERSWPRFGPAAADRGLGAVLSTALLPPAREPALSGALNIYSRRTHGLDEAAAQTTALLLATHASLALAHVTAVTQRQLDQQRMRRAIDSRDVIGQAKGILMARRGLSPEEAFDLLRRTSQDLNVKLVEVAETLARHHTELDRADGSSPR